MKNVKAKRFNDDPDSEHVQAALADDLFAGGGEMGALMRATDWAQTPLGPVESWPPGLRMMVRLLLANRFPMLLWWGPQFLQLYNDAYRPVLGTKHPQYLGRPVRECWSEIWDVIGPLIETPFNGGPATWMEDILLEVKRYGFTEETHFTIAYSPVPDETAPNGIGGVLATVHEISEKVVGERRVALLRDLGARSTEAKTAEEACQIATDILGQYRQDIPFALLYLIDPEGKVADLAATAGVARGTSASPLRVDLDPEMSDTQVWPLAEAVRAATMQVVTDITAQGVVVPPGPWPDPPDSAVVMPIRSTIAHKLAGLLVAGISSRLRLDDAYSDFLTLVASQIATAIANARAYEEERRRAEALAEIDRAKTAFFSNVSHEFRTPLTLLLEPAQDALSDIAEPLPAGQRERVEIVQRNGLRLLKLVNTLLDFSRIEADRAQADYEPTDLATYTADLASAFRSAIEHAGLRFIVDCPPLPDEIGPVYVDREMWEKIVFNLLSNALKFTFTGKITVRLRAEGESVALEVRDTGVGIPLEEQPRLFERFHRVQGIRARTHEGTGIGLALVRDLAKLHGGSVSVTSAVGEGSAFIVRIPTGAAHLPAERIGAARTQASTALGSAPYVEEALRWLPNEPAALPAPLSSQGEGLGVRTPAASAAPLLSAGLQSASGRGWGRGSARILLVDDNADMRDYVARLLAPYWEVEAAGDGAAALAALRERAPDLVLADIMMPELDGFALLRALRADERTRTIPVILLSARAGEEATVEGLAAGADDYLVKPFSAQELLARVAGRLELAQARRVVMEHASQLEATFDAGPDALALYDCDGRIVQVNALARKLVASLTATPNYITLPYVERRKQPLFSAADGRPFTEEQWPQGRVLRGETLTGASAVDLLAHTLNGDELRLNLSGAPIHDAQGQIIGAVCLFHDVTERRALEDALRRSEAEFRQLADAMPQFVWTARPDGWHDYYNRRWHEYTGIPFEQAQGWGWKPALHPDDVQPCIDIWGHAVATGEPYEIEYRFKRATDGTFHWFLGRGLPVKDEQGQIVKWYGSCTDIDDQKRLERELAERAGQLDAIYSAIPDLVCVYDAQGNVLRANAATERVLATHLRPDYYDLSIEERTAAAEMRDAQGIPITFDQFPAQRAMRGEQMAGAETADLFLRAFDGREIVLNWSGAPILDAEGRAIGSVCVYRDVTQRRHLEQRAHQSLAALLAMAEALVTMPTDETGEAASEAHDDAAPTRQTIQRMVTLTQHVLAGAYTSIVMLDMETKSLQPLAVAGLPLAHEAHWWADLRGARLEDFMSSADAERLHAGEDVIFANVTNQPPVPGKDYWDIQTNLVVPVQQDGRLILLTVEVRDRPTFTPQERELARAAARLAALVIAREEAQREREEARARVLALDEANARMDEFLGIAGHELRTPLTSIKASVQLLARRLRTSDAPAVSPTRGGEELGGRQPTNPNSGKNGNAASSLSEAPPSLAARANQSQPDPTRRLLDRAEHQVDRLGRLVNDLLDISRIHAGKLELRRERCDLAAIVRECTQEQQQSWPARAISLDLPSEPIEVWADADRVGQVLTNYLTNALKYSAEDRPVAVGLDATGETARVAVRDQGPGLPPEEQESIWERFHRASGVQLQSGSGVGLGLGLHISKTLIERHGGAVGVESIPGAGSTFWFTLPLNTTEFNSEGTE